MKVFWDTNLFIYLWEQKAFVEEMSALEHFVDSEGHLLATSTLTMAEILVRPTKLGQQRVIRDYHEAFRAVELVGFDKMAATVFAELRAEHSSLRPPDAIQLACAIRCGCDLFLTNDERLSTIRHSRLAQVQSLSGWHRSRVGRD